MIKHGARRFTVRHGSAGRRCQFVENGRIHQEIPHILRLKVEDFLMEIFGKFVTKPSGANDRASIAFFFLPRSEEHTSELQSLMRISYAVFCLKKKNTLSHKN